MGGITILSLILAIQKIKKYVLTFLGGKKFFIQIIVFVGHHIGVKKQALDVMIFYLLLLLLLPVHHFDPYLCILLVAHVVPKICPGISVDTLIVLTDSIVQVLNFSKLLGDSSM